MYLKIFTKVLFQMLFIFPQIFPFQFNVLVINDIYINLRLVVSNKCLWTHDARTHINKK